MWDVSKTLGKFNRLKLNSIPSLRIMIPKDFKNCWFQITDLVTFCQNFLLCLCTQI